MFHNYTILTHRNFAQFTIKLEYLFFVEFLLAKRWTLQNIFEILILKIFESKNTMFFVFLQNIVYVQTIFAPEIGGMETIRRFLAFLIAVSTSHL